MPTAVSLSHMVDLALGTPEVGAVNFNVLHTLFHAIIGKLNIGDSTADINDSDKEFLSKKKPDTDTQSEADSAVTGLGTRPASGSTLETTPPGKDGGPGSSSSSSHGPVPYHALEQKVQDLQSKMQALNELPSSAELYDRVTKSSDNVSEKSRPVSDMWQNMQLTRRVDANEDGVKKLMSLVEDMMSEMQQIRDQNETLKKQLDKALEEAGKDKGIDGLDDLLKRLKDLEDTTSDLKDRLSLYPDPDTFNDFVTWSGLEDALKGLRDNINNLSAIPERVVIEMSSQTDPMSRPQSARPSSSRSRASTTPGPSAELVDILEKLGRLSDQHDSLEERVRAVEDELSNKLDKGALDGLGIPQELIDQLNQMKDDLEALKQNREKDTDALARLQQAILQLQGELERISNTTQQLVDDTSNHKKDIQSLYGLCNKLEENKADKEFVQTEVEVKADKRHLDGKVNRSLFDSTCDELNKMINDILSKLLGHEEEWKKALSSLSDDLDGKLDRLEFGPIKDELERQLRALLKKLKNLNFNPEADDDDAAGIRKQLLQRYNCISCDRPVEMAPQGPIPSIPQTNGMPGSKSTRPYTTFELDTIRQHAKSAPNTQIDIMDLYSTQRSCGGSHTLTYPSKRMTRLTQMNTLFRDEVEAMPAYKEEQDIQGADGHVYKGRTMDTKLPNLTDQSKSPTMSRRTPHPPTSQSVTEEMPPKTAPAGRAPLSARGGSRPSSAPGSREHILTQVPTGREFVPPPAPAPSEPDPSEGKKSPVPPPVIKQAA